MNFDDSLLDVWRDLVHRLSRAHREGRDHEVDELLNTLNALEGSYPRVEDYWYV